MSRDPLDQLAGLFERTHETLQRHAALSVDSALVARNWLFGWYIEELERGGATRAEVYGKGVMKELSQRLSARGLRGCSVENLNKFSRFYRAHPEIRSALSSGSSGGKMRPTLSTESSAAGRPRRPGGRCSEEAHARGEDWEKAMTTKLRRLDAEIAKDLSELETIL